MRGFAILITLCLLAASINNYVLHDKINSIKQDITELRKDFSYDPKDAK
ncbi:hypothetical protein KAR91_09875 [Candidatus Pacearchaeota archaeon]|nr:hypothetical protein [Candidatus Pacearchaeota archaeon]